MSQIELSFVFDAPASVPLQWLQQLQHSNWSHTSTKGKSIKHLGPKSKEIHKQRKITRKWIHKFKGTHTPWNSFPSFSRQPSTLFRFWIKVCSNTARSYLSPLGWLKSIQHSFQFGEPVNDGFCFCIGIGIAVSVSWL